MKTLIKTEKRQSVISPWFRDIFYEPAAEKRKREKPTGKALAQAGPPGSGGLTFE
jgi:hypothetical protein